jgi:hypothetical protein
MRGKSFANYSNGMVAMRPDRSGTLGRGNDGTASDLRRIVRINEEIKTIVATAFRINLMALNAIFLAKRAGQAALGFGVLSNELRGFAVALGDNMNELRRMTFSSVVAVTAMVKRARLERILECTDRQSDGKAQALLATRNTPATNRRGCDADDMKTIQRELQQRLDDTARLIELGAILARSAKIEAAYGGTFSAPLTQVSTEFDSIIGLTLRSIDSLRKQHLTRKEI